MHLSLERKNKTSTCLRDKLSIFISLVILSVAICRVSAEQDLVLLFFDLPFTITVTWYKGDFRWKLTSE